MVDTWNVQVAIVQLLKQYDVCSGRVYDDVPADVTFPYVEVAEVLDINDDTSLSDAVQQVQTLRVWSRYRGQKQVKEIVGQIRSILHHKNVVVTGLASCITFIEGVTHLTDPDGVTRQATVRVQLNARE